MIEIRGTSRDLCGLRAMGLGREARRLGSQTNGAKISLSLFFLFSHSLKRMHQNTLKDCRETFSQLGWSELNTKHSATMGLIPSPLVLGTKPRVQVTS